MTCTNPLVIFVFNLIADIGGDVFTIGPKLETVRNTYNNNKSTDSLGNIINNLATCLQPHFGEVEAVIIDEIRTSIIFIVIATAILVVLIVILFALLDKKLHYDAIILLSILFAILYIIICYLFLQHAKNNIDTVIDNNEITILNCINSVSSELTLLEQTNANAAQLALCAY